VRQLARPKMATNLQNVLDELGRRHRSAARVVVAFFILDLVLLAIAYFAGASLYRTGDPSIVMGLWIAILQHVQHVVLFVGDIQIALIVVSQALRPGDAVPLDSGKGRIWLVDEANAL